MAAKDLIPVRTTEEAKKRGRNGGLKSAETRRRKREMADTAKLFLDLAANDKLKENLEKLGIKKSEQTNQMALIARAFMEAMNGDIKAMEFLRDTAGYNPRLKVEERMKAMEYGSLSDDGLQKVEIYIPDNNRDK